MKSNSYINILKSVIVHTYISFFTNTYIQNQFKMNVFATCFCFFRMHDIILIMLKVKVTGKGVDSCTMGACDTPSSRRI